MDRAEILTRQTEMRLEQLRHRVGPKHADLQNRFLFALTSAAGVFVAILRSELPTWTVAVALVPLGWAWAERQRIQRLSIDHDRSGEALVRRLDDLRGPQASGDPGANQG